ncbi:Monocarboxylate transporter 2 [Exaiptasia diaphana]|nr:Monocarboxylate transporter 2 [Exaiptasia diaphana]
MTLVHLAKFSEDIGIDSYRSSWLYFIIGFSSTTSRLLVGKFGKVGPLSLLDIALLGNVILALGNFVLPSTSVYYGMVLYSIGYGVGEGLVYTPIFNIAIDSVPADKRGSGYGIFQMCYCLAYLIGPILSEFWTLTSYLHQIYNL